MSYTTHFETDSAMLSLMADVETFDGACDPDYDNDAEELERQFAEFRLTVASDLN